jgi:uncharacterized protein
MFHFCVFLHKTGSNYVTNCTFLERKAKMEFKRNIEEKLLAWKHSEGRKPLLLQGARQVGKTSLLKWLGNQAFEDTAYFNFEEQAEIRQLFQNTKDPIRIIQNLTLVHGKKIEPASTLIIFDEIQECGDALNSLKYFKEKAGEYAIAAAGSLLGVTLGRTGGFPVGMVNFLQVNPLSFSEYLSKANHNLHAYLIQLKEIDTIPDIFFNPLKDHFKRYFISGGMPEAASKLVESDNLESTDAVLKDILQSYTMDFIKHATSKDIVKIDYTWKSIPAQLAKENKKFLYQVVKPGARARDYEDALLWLVQAGLVHRVYHCNKPQVPLAAYDDLSAFKLYLHDVGILRKLAQLDATSFTSNLNLFTEFKGAFTENYILQSLFNQFEVMPRYWTSPGKAEIDFLLQYKNQIIPCEVKAAENVHSRSLGVYREKFNPNISIRYSLKNLQYREGLLNIPLFMADDTQKMLDTLL